MHYYQFNIADYRKDTTHLTLIEHAIYRQLLDWYYLDEKPIPLETQWVIRRFPLGYEQVEMILKEFFEQREDGWHHERCDIEINNYQHNAEKNRRNGKLGGRPKKTQWDASGEPKPNPNETQTKANQELLTINQEPLTKSTESNSLPDKPAKERKRASVLADDFAPNENGVSYATVKQLNFEQELIGFRNWHSAKGTTFKDWQAAWRTWCDKAVEFGRSGNKSNGGGNGKNGSSRADRVSATIAELTGANRDSARTIDGNATRVD